ncbi:MAG TPA: hypothetical protein PK951_10205 [Chitinophagaceae bacterium]|nr:hypothetical protein [Chitinophagaceae bacterium]HUM66706.1 hypothetical protein [Chitinophagaceae bacterium]
MLKSVRLFFSVVLLSTLQPCLAQNDSTLSQKIVNEFCIEFSKKDFEKFKGAELEIGLIAVPLIEKYKNEIEKEWNLTTENDEDYTKISERIGKEAAFACPKFLEFLKNNLDEISEFDEDEIKSIEGTFQRLDEQAFSTLIIKTKTGKDERLWWLGYFEGESALKSPATLSKKNLALKYADMEVYDPKLKEYRTIKVIKKLEVK